MSAAGDALHTLPASVARLRICTEPTTAAASARAGACRRTSGSAATSVMTVVAPITRLPPSHADPRRQLRDTLDVHHKGGRQRAVTEPDHQVRAAGEDARLRPAVREQGDGLGQ